MSQWDYPAILAEAQPYVGLDPSTLEAVWRAGKPVTLRAGEQLFAQGDPAERLFVLLEGSVKMVQVNAEGDEVVAGFITPGEMFACVAALGEQSYPASAIVVEDGRAVGWPQDTFRSLLIRHPEIGRNTMGTLGQRLQNTRERMAEMATKTSEQRIAAALLRLSRRRSDRPAEGAAARAPITASRQDIAAMSGTGLYTVSRTLQSWSRRGLVEVGRRQVAVADPEGLQRVYEGR